MLIDEPSIGLSPLMMRDVFDTLRRCGTAACRCS